MKRDCMAMDGLLLNDKSMTRGLIFDKFVFAPCYIKDNSGVASCGFNTMIYKDAITSWPSLTGNLLPEESRLSVCQLCLGT